MDVSTVPDVPVLLAGSAVPGTERPLLTYYNDATGERVELSASDLAGWAARTAGLLRGGCGLDAGGRAAALLSPHWQTAAVLLGAWSVGVAVSWRSTATAGLPVMGEPELGPLDVLFVSRNRLGSWLEDVPEAWHRFVLDLGLAGTTPEVELVGYRDYLAEARGHSDALPPSAVVRPSDPASPDGTSYEEWGRLAGGLAATLGWGPGERVLVDAAEHDHPVKWLLAPLAVGGSVVLCANLDPGKVEARKAAEGITRVL